MFDKIILRPTQTEYVPYEKTVIEKRAPTDDSIRIYEEIKEKAYNSILDSIKINTNEFNLKAIVYEDLLSYQTVCKYEFSINGRIITDKIILEKYNSKDESQLLKIISNECSKKLSEVLCEVVIKEHLK